jgi:hypothetical protein
MGHSGVSLLTAGIVAVVAYLMGFTHAWTARARADWKMNKAAAKARRRLFFGGVVRLVQIGFVALLIAGGLLWWVARDIGDGRATPLVPAGATPGPGVGDGGR